MHVPRWAVAPTSGAGARKHGGRFNRPGVDALYLALETETAIREYQRFHAAVSGGLQLVPADGPLAKLAADYQHMVDDPCLQPLHQ